MNLSFLLVRPILLGLLALNLTACSPFQETDEERERRLKKNPTPAATTTPKPTPKPGAWMTENRDNPLDRKPGK